MGAAASSFGAAVGEGGVAPLAVPDSAASPRREVRRGMQEVWQAHGWDAGF
jgi:hypothetical protein